MIIFLFGQSSRPGGCSYGGTLKITCMDNFRVHERHAPKLANNFLMIPLFEIIKNLPKNPGARGGQTTPTLDQM